jgi:hypothetical protein
MPTYENWVLNELPIVTELTDPDYVVLIDGETGQPKKISGENLSADMVPILDEGFVIIGGAAENEQRALVAADVSGIQALIDASVAALVNSSPSTLDTLNEIAAALGNDANFSATITGQLAGKASLSGNNTFAGSNSFQSIGLGGAPVINDVYVNFAPTINTANFQQGIFINPTLTGTGFFIGLRSLILTSGNQNFTSLVAANMSGNKTGSGTATTLTGGQFGFTNSGTGNVGTLQGFISQPGAIGSNIITTFIGVYSSLFSTGAAAITLAKIVDVNLSAIAGTATYTELRGVNIANWTKVAGVTVTTSYGIYADTTIDVGATRYFIYSLSTSPSELAGTLQATAFKVAGNQVVGAQQAAITDAVGGDEVTKINAILAALRTHGLIAT